MDVQPGHSMRSPNCSCHHPCHFVGTEGLDEQVIDPPPKSFRPELLVGHRTSNHDIGLLGVLHHVSQDVTPVAIWKAHGGDHQIERRLPIHEVASLSASVDRIGVKPKGPEMLQK
jgi:hypothetical protein